MLSHRLSHLFKRNAVEEVAWNFDTFGAGKAVNMNAPVPRNPLDLPFVDRLSIDLPAGRLTEGGGHPGPSAQRLNEISVTVHHEAIFRRIIGKVNTDNKSDDKPMDRRQRVRMAPDRETDHKRQEGMRLRTLRLAMGYKKRPDFLRALYSKQNVDSEQDRLEKWEAGINRIDDWFIRQLKDWCGVTHDYIRDGDRDGLPVKLYNAIVDYERKAG